MVELSKEELQRYARHLALPEVGEEGQAKLKAASVLIVGAGGLGSPCALYLAAAGVGHIGLVDFDTVDASNLQRQILHSEKNIGESKVDSAREKLQDLNSNVDLDIHNEKLSSENALSIFENYDVIVDGSDNFPTRYLVNDACVLLKKPYVFASVFRFEGQASVFNHGGPCYRCVFREPPPANSVPSCEEGGVLGVVPGVMGVIQATEAIKIILGIGETLSTRLLFFDALKMNFRELKTKKRDDCSVCGVKPTVTELIDYEAYCNPQSSSKDANDSFDITPEELKQKLDANEKIILLDVREDFEREICVLKNDVHIPLLQLEEKIDELNKNKTIVAYCHSGGRSAQAVSILRNHGFTNVKNLTGGIDAWAERVEPGMKRY